LAVEQQLMQIDSQDKQRRQLEVQIAELDSEHQAVSASLKQLRSSNDPLKQEHAHQEAELRSLHTAHEREDSAGRKKVRDFCH
jgi:septal ring factor EnvC (AmiA/AmiB activator)